jgi:hypothetical protein
MTCTYQQICKNYTNTCNEDYVFCEIFANFINNEFERVKESREQLRQANMFDIGLVKRVIQDFRVEGVE